jgi:uncharacterized GH25 family protein
LKPARPFILRSLLAALALPALALGPDRALAHEFWLAPSRYRAVTGDTVSVAAFVGTGFRGERIPYPTTRTLRLVLRADREADARRAALNGDLAFLRFVVPNGDGALVAYQSNFARIELPAGEFDQYLALEGLDGPHAARARLGPAAGPGSELYSRCPKAWIAGTRSERVTRPVGLPLEIVPLADPGGASRLAVRVLYRGRPLAGVLVRAWHRSLGPNAMPYDAAARDSVPPTAQVRTDRRGIAALSVAAAGEWLLSAVHMVPSADKGVADWESYWASLTFARLGSP